MNFLKNLFNKKDNSLNYQDFWAWFQKNEKAFFKVVKQQGDIEKVFFDKLSPKLAQVKEDFFFLTGMSDENTVELVFTADGIIKNFVFVEELVAAAPQIAGWKFVAHKPAIATKDFRISMTGYDFSTKNMHFIPNHQPNYPDEIAISIVYDDFNEKDKSVITNGIYIYLDNFLGELEFAVGIDTVHIIGKENVKEGLVPLEKLKDYLVWREKEFIEKYTSKRQRTETANFLIYEVILENGTPIIAYMNADLLEWDEKASYPWLMTVEIKYDGEQHNGMPDKQTYQLLDEIENMILAELKDFEGYLSIGRQTGDNAREIYYACTDFRLPSKVLYKIEKEYAQKLPFTYEIFKDKYWQSLHRFIKSQV